jgi:four helix bundle protein
VVGQRGRCKRQSWELNAEREMGKLAEIERLRFGYEDLVVWDKAVRFAVEVITAVDHIATDRKHYRLLEQIESSSAGISMNLAEGKGRFSKKEFTQYCYIARGSLYETMTLLEIFKRVNWISDEEYFKFETAGIEIASMIKGLINSLKT